MKVLTMLPYLLIGPILLSQKVKGSEGMLQSTAMVPYPHQRLVKDLLDEPQGYDPRVRPVTDFNRPVKVEMRMNLYQILSVDEPRQKIILYVWVTQYWTDEFLGWDPSHYDGIRQIILPYDKVWLPDTYLYNSLEMEREISERWITVIYNSVPNTKNVSKNRVGEQNVAQATFQYPAIYQVSCKMNIQFFPFDKQNCSMTFGSWTQDSKGIDYDARNGNVTFESYVENEEWSVLSFTFIREEIEYACCPTPYVLLHANLIMQRKSLYYMVNLVIPTSVITLIAVVGFFMPASTNGERSEKINLGITTLLAMSILLLMMSEQMPTTSDLIPMIGWFFLGIIFLTSLGTIMTSVVILIQKQGYYGRQVPAWPKKFFIHRCAKLVGLKPPTALAKEMEREKQKEAEFKAAKKGEKVNGKRKNMLEEEEEDELVTPASLGPIPILFQEPNGYSPQTLRREDMRHTRQPSRQIIGLDHVGPSITELGVSKLDEIHGILTQIVEREEEKGREELQMLEWEFLASVIDRILLISFSTGVILLTSAVFVIGRFFKQD